MNHKFVCPEKIFVFPRKDQSCHIGVPSHLERRIAGTEYDNFPQHGFHLTVHHENWYAVDPRGFRLEIKNSTVRQLMHDAPIINGDILAPCVWFNRNSVVELVVVGSPSHREMVENATRKSKQKVKFTLGDICVLRTGETGVFVGHFDVYTAIKDYGFQFPAPKRAVFIDETGQSFFRASPIVVDILGKGEVPPDPHIAASRTQSKRNIFVPVGTDLTPNMPIGVIAKRTDYTSSAYTISNTGEKRLAMYHDLSSELWQDFWVYEVDGHKVYAAVEGIYRGDAWLQ